VLLRSREIEAARRDPKSYLGNRGDQKVVITYRYTGDESLGDVIWTALAPTANATTRSRPASNSPCLTSAPNNPVIIIAGPRKSTPYSKAK